MCAVLRIKSHTFPRYPYKKALVILALLAVAFFLGFIAGENTSVSHEEITGTYVSGFVTLSIDAGQKVFYYSDTQNNVFFTGKAEPLSAKCCKLEAVSETIPQQIVANSDGILYCCTNGNVCAMKKAYDVVVRVDTTN